MKKTVGWIIGFVTVVVFGSTALGVGFAFLIPATLDLAVGTTDYEQLDLDFPVQEQRSIVQWNDGTVMTQLYRDQDRSPARLRQIPQHVIDAVISIEDRDFYEHEGVDVRGTARALVRDIEGQGGLQGGSTITQQLVKVALYPNAARTAKQKTIEAIVAAQIENQYSKDEILERYLNEVYYGSGAYGIKAAAERYFNRPLRNLSVADGALLAGLIRSPENLNPITNPERALARRSQVLDAMVETDRLGRSEAARARTLPLPTTLHRNAKYKPDSYFVSAMIDHLVDDENPASAALGPDPTARRSRLFGGGLRIRTTLDPEMQAHGELAVRRGLPTGTPVTAALVAVDNTTGGVRAMVGGVDFAQTEYNLATQGARQPGSSFKTFVLAAALKTGYSPNDTILGESRCSFPSPLATTPPDPYVVSARGGGVMSLRTAMTDSINCAFVRLIISLGHGADGPAQVIATAREMGVERSNLVPVTSLALGTSGVTPLEMASAYSTIAADGVRHDAAFVEEILGPDGEVVYRAGRTGTAALRPQIARTLTQMLEGPVRDGTAASTLGDFPRPAAGKTGTTNSNVDAWFVGYTAQLSAAVWVGQPECGDNDDPECSLSGYLGDEAFGGRAPARIWGSFMEPALAGEPVIGFPEPDPEQFPTSQYVSERGRLARIVPIVPTTTTEAPTTTTRPPRTTTSAPPSTNPPTTSPPTTSPPTTTTSTTVPGP